MYYADPEKFDLSKYRADAHKYSRGDQHNEPQTVIIHHHHHEVPCKKDVDENQKHEVFAAVIGEEK